MQDFLGNSLNKEHAEVFKSNFLITKIIAKEGVAIFISTKVENLCSSKSIGGNNSIKMLGYSLTFPKITNKQNTALLTKIILNELQKAMPRQSK